MYCKECGKENLDTEIKCNSCNTILNTNLPLDGTERVKIITSLLLLLTPFLWIAGIIILASFYIMKKDKKFASILNAQKYIKIYFTFLVFIGIIIIIFNLMDDILYNNFNVMSIIINLSFIFGVLIIGVVTMLIYDNLFFKILNEHKEWIINNDFFSDEKISKDTLINEYNNDNVSSHSIADKIFKLNDLLEKKLITKEEFQNAKENILKGKYNG